MFRYTHKKVCKCDLPEKKKHCSTMSFWTALQGSPLSFVSKEQLTIFVQEVTLLYTHQHDLLYSTCIKVLFGLKFWWGTDSMNDNLKLTT